MDEPTLEMKQMIVTSFVDSLLTAYTATALNVTKEKYDEVIDSLCLFTFEDGSVHILSDSLHGHVVDSFRFMHEPEGYVSILKVRKLNHKMNVMGFSNSVERGFIISDLTLISILASLLSKSVIGEFDDAHNRMYLSNVYHGWLYL